MSRNRFRVGSFMTSLTADVLGEVRARMGFKNDGYALDVIVRDWDDAGVGSLDCRLDAFWRRVDMSGGPDACWPWRGGMTYEGYGIALFDGKSTTAHRIAYILTHGPIEPSLVVCHHCDNPPCCNPKHLFDGTQRDNIQDSVRKGHRGNGYRAPKIARPQKTNGVHRATMAEKQTVLIVDRERVKTKGKSNNVVIDAIVRSWLQSDRPAALGIDLSDILHDDVSN